MIVLSFLLVVIAAVTLLVGLFQDTLTYIWISIASCVVAMIALGVGVLQRRSGGREPEEADEAAYGPGAITSLIPGDGEPEERAAAPADDVTVVPKRSVSDARGEISRAEAEAAAEKAVAETAGPTDEPVTATRNEGAEKATKTAKKATKKAAKKATKKSTKKAARKTPRKAAKRTTGKAARERLDAVKGLGPAKQEALLKEFGSLEGIRDAGIEDLLQVKGIGATTAEEIRKQLS